MTLSQGAAGGFTNRGEGGYNQVIEGSSVGNLLAKLVGSGLKFRVRQRLDFGFQAIDGLNPAFVGLQFSIVGRAKNLAGN